MNNLIVYLKEHTNLTRDEIPQFIERNVPEISRRLGIPEHVIKETLNKPEVLDYIFPPLDIPMEIMFEILKYTNDLDSLISVCQANSVWRYACQNIPSVKARIEGVKTLRWVCEKYGWPQSMDDYPLFNNPSYSWNMFEEHVEWRNDKSVLLDLIPTKFSTLQFELISTYVEQHAPQFANLLVQYADFELVYPWVRKNQYSSNSLIEPFLLNPTTPWSFIEKHVPHREIYRYIHSIVPKFPDYETCMRFARNEPNIHRMISKEPWLDLKIVDENPDLEWSWGSEGLSDHPNITLDFVKRHSTKTWSTLRLGAHPNIDISEGIAYFENSTDIIFHSYVLGVMANPNLTKDVLQTLIEYIRKIPEHSHLRDNYVSYLVRNHSIPIDVITETLDTIFPLLVRQYPSILSHPSIKIHHLKDVNISERKARRHLMENSFIFIEPQKIKNDY